MTYFLAVFKSRTQTLNFYEIMQRAGVPCSVVNTPREASVGCGISVRFDGDDLPRVRRIYSLNTNLSFTGFYKVMRGGSGNTVTKV